MAYVLLRRVPVANEAPATGYTVRTVYYDTEARKTYTGDPVQTTTNTGTNAPFELAVGTTIPGASFCVNQTQRQVRYAGQGTVSTHDVPNAPACASNLAGLTLSSTGLRTVYEQGAQLTATWRGAVGAVTVRCALLQGGTAAVAPYYCEQTLAAGTTTAKFPAVLGQEELVPFERRGRAVRLTRYTLNAGLGSGRYRVEVTEEATGATISEEFTIRPDASEQPRTGVRDTAMLYATGGNAAASYGLFTSGGLRLVFELVGFARSVQRLYLEPATVGESILRVHIAPISSTQARIREWVYNSATHAVAYGEVVLDTAVQTFPGINYGEALPAIDYFLPAGTPIPSLPANGLLISNGQAGVHALRYAFHQRLTLDNLILFQPPTPTGTGGLIVEVNSSADVDPAANDPLYYRVLDAAGNILQTNQTGRFDLPAGSYRWAVTNGTTTISEPFTLACDYGKKWVLNFEDEGNNAPCRLELWVRDYTGPVLSLEAWQQGEDGICGQGDGPGPVSISGEGLSGGENQNDLPDSIGRTMTLRLFSRPALLQDVLLSGFACRSDFYYNNGLRFTGYIQPEIYEEELLAGPVNVALTAACGLGALKDVAFQGHAGQELRGRRPVLHTLLHCLSRTGLTLPLALYTNRKPVELSSEETPELGLGTDRLAYTGDGKPRDLRSVIDALCQLLGGTLVQRYATWYLISPLEAALPAAGRQYTPAAGSGGPANALASPTLRILPPRQAETALQNPPYPRAVAHWLDGEQRRQRRAGWNYLTGTGDAGFAENAFRQGTYFSNADLWDESATVLRPEAGWQAGPGGFPLRLVEAGGENDERAAVWPLATTTSDPRYLESELAPVESGREGLPMEISVSAKLLGPTAYVAYLWVEIVAVRGAEPVSLGAVLPFKAVAGLSDGFSTAKALLPVGALAGAIDARVRLHAYTTYTPGRARTTVSGDVTHLLVKTVAIQVLPQGAKWKGETAFLATGTGGSVRPESPLEVVHVDTPQNAGLFQGTAYAFRNTVTRGYLGPTTQWARPDDLQAASLLASAVLDVLALRSNPSQLTSGPVRVLGNPPEPLDSLDDPYSVNGRRFLVGSCTWDVQPARATITNLEIGAGEFVGTPPPFLPNGVRVLRGLGPNGAVRVLLSRRPTTARVTRL